MGVVPRFVFRTKGRYLRANFLGGRDLDAPRWVQRTLDFQGKTVKMPFHRALLARGPDGTKGRVVYSKANRDLYSLGSQNALLSPIICLPTTLNPDEPQFLFPSSHLDHRKFAPDIGPLARNAAHSVQPLDTSDSLLQRSKATLELKDRYYVSCISARISRGAGNL